MNLNMKIANPTRKATVPHQVRLKLQAMQGRLRAAEQRAVDLLLRHPETILQGPISAFAQQAGCSPATAVRLARTLGYAGFPEMRQDFHHETGEPLYEGVRISRADDIHSIARKIFEASAQGLQDTIRLLNPLAYEQALHALLEAQRIAFIGLGDAAVVAREACLKFLRIGVTAFDASDPDVQIILAAAQLRRKDVLVVFSHSGATRPLLPAIRRARQSGATVVLITNFPKSPLVRHADLVLETAVFQEHINREVIAKRVAELCLIESLYANYLVRRGAEAQRQLAATNASLTANKM